MDSERLLDLHHLTEVEQKVILSVLWRDAALRIKDEGRIRKLKQTMSDPVLLRSFSGAWFCDERAKRHRKGGADVVHASIRRKKRDKEAISDAEEETPVIKVEASQGRVKENTTSRTEDISSQDEDGGEDAEKLFPRLEARHIAEIGSVARNVPEARVGDSLDTGCLEEDSDGDIDSGSTELGYNRFGSVTSLTSRYMLTGSLMSLYSVGDFRNVVVSGRIQLSLQYDLNNEELHLRIIRCQDLAAARKQRSDPYVKVYLLPDNTSRSKRKTAVKRKTLNPVYDESVNYNVCRPDLQARVLSVSVWHMERMRRNLFLGEVEVKLSQWDWSQNQPTWHRLQPRAQIRQTAVLSRGTILFSIKFIPPGSDTNGFLQTGELHIWLREIVGLLPVKRRAPNSYVKSVILPDESGACGQQTRVVRGSINPLFNHTMVYDGFQSSDLVQACAEITVWNQHSSCLGGVRLSIGSGVSYGQPVCWMDSTTDEISVWSRVIQSPNSWVDASLPVRNNLQLCSQ